RRKELPAKYIISGSSKPGFATRAERWIIVEKVVDARCQPEPLIEVIPHREVKIMLRAEPRVGDRLNIGRCSALTKRDEVGVDEHRPVVPVCQAHVQVCYRPGNGSGPTPAVERA